MKKIALLISCEHAVASIPKPYQPLFIPFQKLLSTHRGVDFGALDIALHLKKAFSCDFVQAKASRLLIDCNRSLWSSNCFSEATQGLSPREKQEIIDHYYLPFRQQVIALIEQHRAAGLQVWHLSIHSFTPVMNDIVRTADIGFLYDPRRLLEKKLAKSWQLELKQQAPEYRVRLNYPYKGISDGFTSFLRKQYASDDYLGIEIESNQALTLNDNSMNNLKKILSLSLLNSIY